MKLYLGCYLLAHILTIYAKAKIRVHHGFIHTYFPWTVVTFHRVKPTLISITHCDRLIMGYNKVKHLIEGVLEIRLSKGNL